MRKYIHKLREKPEEHRQRILFMALAVSMIFVGFIWIYTLGYRISSSTAEKVDEDVAPFALFGESISNTYKNLSASIGNISLPKKEEEKKLQKQINLIPIERTE